VMRLNGLRKSIIIPGQRLIVRAGSSHSSHAGSSRKSTTRKAKRH